MDAGCTRAALITLILPRVSAPADLSRIDASRRRVTVGLTVAMMVIYFGFILLIAFNRPLLAVLIAPGLSLGILLGALVIVAAWVLLWVYVGWANRHYDTAVDAIRSGSRVGPP